MVGDLLWHELEVVKSFFARTMSWVVAESAAESARLANIDDPDNDTIEGIVNDPQSALSLEQVAIRSVVNELNSLCEFALQNTFVSLSNEYNISNGDFVFSASRGQIEKALLAKGADVNTWPQWREVLKIKEMSEGFKHRQRMQPFPVELVPPAFKWRATRVVDPNNCEWITEYESTPLQVAQFISAVEELLRWLQRKYAI